MCLEELFPARADSTSLPGGEAGRGHVQADPDFLILSATGASHHCPGLLSTERQGSLGPEARPGPPLSQGAGSAAWFGLMDSWDNIRGIWGGLLS